MKYKLNELCEVTSSKRIFAREYSNNGVPFYRGKEITQLSRHQLITDNLFISDEIYANIKESFGVPTKNDILLTAVGTLGSIYLVKDNDPFYFKDGNLIWLKEICQSIIDPRYLYYLLISSKMQQLLVSKSIGSSQPALTIDAVKSLSIEVPNIRMQQHIVNILGTIDDKIENNEKKIIKLKRLMLAVFNNFQNKLLEYETIPIGEFISFIKGKKPNDVKVHLLPYLSIDAMTTNNYEFACSDEMILANTNDILMVMDGASSGTVYSGHKGIVGSTLAKLNCKNREISVLIEQRLIQMQNKIKELNTGSAIPHANKEFIQSITIKLSNDEFQAKIIDQLNFLKQKILSCRSLNIKLIKLKNFYLKKFFG